MAASGKYGRLSEFHAGVDSVDDYQELFALFCAANDIDDDDKRKAVFLTSVGTSTYTLLKNLVRPRKPQELTLADLVELLRKYYQPRVVVIAERFRFYKRHQRDSDSIAVYLAELRRLAKDSASRNISQRHFEIS